MYVIFSMLKDSILIVRIIQYMSLERMVMAINTAKRALEQNPKTLSRPPSSHSLLTVTLYHIQKSCQVSRVILFVLIYYLYKMKIYFYTSAF